METMLAGDSRGLPPVPPRPAASGVGARRRQQVSDDSDDTAPVRPTRPSAVHTLALDDGQDFVARLRGAAADFAAAAGAQSAVVREAVPPARHRRSRCRLVLRYPDGSEVDLTFLGAADRPGARAQYGFGESIRRWLRSGQPLEPAWLVPDEDAAEDIAVDVTAWIAAR